MTLQYNMVVRTRYQYMAQMRSDVAHLPRVMCFVHFADTDGLTFRVRVDGARFDNTVAYNQERQSGRSATGSSDYRHHIAVHLPDGIFGSFVDVTTTKVVPTTGDMEYEGVQYDVTPFEREDEFSTGSY